MFNQFTFVSVQYRLVKPVQDTALY